MATEALVAVLETAVKQNIDKHGIYDLTLDEYLAYPCAMPSISSSGLRTILNECPAKYWWNSPLNPEQEAIDKDAWWIGRAAHLLLPEPELPREQIHVMGAGVDFRAKAAKAERYEAIEADKTVIKDDQYQTIKAMRDALAEHDFAGAAFENGKPEQSLIWRDQETGIWLRYRPDVLPTARLHILDYKTAASSKPEDFRNRPDWVAFFNAMKRRASEVGGVGIKPLREANAAILEWMSKESPRNYGALHRHLDDIEAY